MSAWKGSEWRRSLWLLGAAFLMSSAVSAWLLTAFLEGAGRQVLASHQAFVGRLVIEEASLDLGFFKETPSEAERLAGEKALQSVGYREGMPAWLFPAFAEGAVYVPAWAVALSLAWGVPAFAALWLVFRSLARRADCMAHAADRAMEGDYSLPVPDDGDSGFDRLGHKFNQMRERMSQGLMRLEHDQASLRDALSDISHQLKTPLATALMYTELAMDSPDLSRERQRDFLMRSCAAMERMDWLIRHLLMMARLESGQVPFRSEPVPLTDVMEAAADATASLAASCGVRIVTEPLPECAGVLGDREWLAEALTNLVKNAVEHAGDDRIVRVRAMCSPLICRILVEDHGAGIPESEWPHLFERFHARSGGGKSDAVGIGLSLAQLIVRRLDGDLMPGRTPGGGATFTIILPRLPQAAEEAMAECRSAQEDAGILGVESTR